MSKVATGIKQTLSRRRKAGLTLDLSEPAAKLHAKDHLVRDLCVQYSALRCYPTIDPNPEDLARRLEMQGEVVQKLTDLCGADWESTVYALFLKEEHERQARI